MNIHHLFLVGRATKDAETLKTKADKIFSKFSVAVNEYKGKDIEEKVYYYDVLVFGNTAAKAKEHIKKGDAIIVQGRPEANAYIPKDGKEPKAKITVLAESWKVLK